MAFLTFAGAQHTELTMAIVACNPRQGRSHASIRKPCVVPERPTMQRVANKRMLLSTCVHIVAVSGVVCKR